MALSPMMTHYLETKKSNPDCILFYRLGDFYEMFFEDARTVAKELELTLTGKDCGLEERAPMCGVPHHAVETYLTRLVSKGYKVAIAEQVEDPKLAKGLVKREVVRIVTPGTLTGEGAIPDEKNNYLMCLVYSLGRFGIAAVDISTGEFQVTRADSAKDVMDEIHRFSPSELIVNPTFPLSKIDLEEIREKTGIVYTLLDNLYFGESTCAKILKEHFKVASLAALSLSESDEATLAGGACLQYLYDTQKSGCHQITRLSVYNISEYMVLDAGTRRNLELVETMREKKKQGSLLWVLDSTKTAMGARLLRNMMEQPLIDPERIVQRLDTVEEFLARYIDREELREYLSSIYDLERLMGRISSGHAGPRDLLAFGSSIRILPHIKSMMQGFHRGENPNIYEELDTLDDLCELIAKSISEESPLGVKEGNIIKDGFHTEVDQYRSAKSEGKNWLAKLEEQERNATSIKGLKIKYNRVFGYYFEVTNSYKDLVPDYFVRKQTLTGSERYTTPKLKELEDMILGAEDKLNLLEYQLFVQIREKIAMEVERIQTAARAVARLDAMISLANVASKQNYVRPTMNTTGKIEITDGRHPVIEKMIGQFIPNDVLLDEDAHRMNIITGPNMAGKSTYMRQTALIALMAQMGSFVPAKRADISICDRIFTRVGASDDLASGQSTFMVEMTEVANIIRNASRKSLIILDEIGRGTSTFDGLAIAWSVAEHIANKKNIGAKTLFATHYHELSELEGSLDGVNNYCVSVKEQGEDIVFLRKIIKGGADKSYGIQVAKLAGVPEEVLVRARELVEELSGADIAVRAKKIAKNLSETKPRSDGNHFQTDMFDYLNSRISELEEQRGMSKNEADVLKDIETLDIHKITPMEAMNILYGMKEKLRKT